MREKYEPALKTRVAIEVNKWTRTAIGVCIIGNEHRTRLEHGGVRTHVLIVRMAP